MIVRELQDDRNFIDKEEIPWPNQFFLFFLLK